MRKQTSTNTENKQVLDASCPVSYTLNLIGGRWKAIIIWHLLQEHKRFSELKRAIGPVTEKMLTQQLRELEKDGLVHRQVYPEVPPKVVYSLTPLGLSLQPILNATLQWGLTHSPAGKQAAAAPPPAPQV